MSIEAVMRRSSVIPVLVLEDAAHARPVVEALVMGGISTVEITLRTPAALEAIREARKVAGALVGAGTVLNEADLRASLDAGAEFIVSPGLTEPFGHAVIASGVPFLPGIANASDIMRGLDMGLTHFKFFPATASGGIGALKALSAPFAECRFCPTGGITQDSAPDWLEMEPVLCVGGSWLVPKGTPDPEQIEAAARAASAFGK